MRALHLARRALLGLLLIAAAGAQDATELPVRIQAAVSGGDRRTIEAFLAEQPEHPAAEEARRGLVRIEADDEAWQRAREEGSEKALRRYLDRGYGWHAEAAESALAELEHQARRDSARQRAAEARTSDDLFAVLEDIPEAAPVLLGKITPRHPLALRDSRAPLTLLSIQGGAEVAFADTEGAIAVYDVESGDRRRAVVPGHRRESVEAAPFLMDLHQRRVALWDGRDVELLEFPSLDRVEDFKMARGVDLEPAVAALTGAGSLVVPGIDALRIATAGGMKTVKTAGTIRALWGAPNDDLALCWRELSAEREGAPLHWQLSRCRGEDGRWTIEDVGAPLELPADPAPTAHFAEVAGATLVAAGTGLTVISTRDGEVLAAGELALAAELSLEGLTPEGRFLVLSSAAGDFSACRIADGFPVAGAFTLPLPRGHVPAHSRYDPRGDRFVTVTGDGSEIAVFGPPGLK